MGCGNPPSNVDLETFICHIWNDVRWFISATGSYERWFENNSAFPPHTVLAYFDSALLHGRTLIEFFDHTQAEKYKQVRACHYLVGSSCSEDLLSKRTDDSSVKLSKWKKAANSSLAHLGKSRTMRHDLTDIVDCTYLPEGGFRTQWKLLSLWELLKPKFERLANESLVPKTQPIFNDLLINAEKALKECDEWTPPKS